MTRRVFVHVGAPKTGTTYLQDRLALNRKELGRHGVHYPIGVHASQFNAALDLIDVDWGGLRDDVRGEWDALMGRVRRHDGTVIVSHEILAAATPAQVRRAMDDLADSEVHLVYSARDIARQVPAEWQEGIKHRRRHTFERFLQRIQNAPRIGSKVWFWRVQGLPDVLSRWSVGLPPERVHLVTVPQPGAPRDLLWQRFCRVFGIDEAWAPAESERSNPSIGIAETTLVRKLNQRLRRTGLDGPSYRSLVRELMVHQTLAHRDQMTRATLPPQLHGWAQVVADEWIDWIEGSGIDVVGDVEELRPLPPPEGEQWHDPDRPRRADMLDAALDALVAVTQEAAARPNREDQMTVRLGRAARRLRGQ